MNDKLGLIGGIGIGAGLMYLLDPGRGRRRRARMRDKLAHALNKTGTAIDTTARDMRNRARGLVSEAGSRLKRGEGVSDEVLVERVRSKMGRVVSHPHSIQVSADHGRVRLSGPILEREAVRLLSCVSSVRGVESIDNQLQEHQLADDIAGLQGGVSRSGSTFELMQANWSPTARVLAGTAGLALMGICATRRDVFGLAAGTLGFGLFIRGATNVELNRIGRQSIDIQKAINVKAPVEFVFDFWTDFERFPRFMRNVREVKKTGEGRYHWTVAGPAGVSVEWDAVVTKLIPNEVIAWKSVSESLVEHTGIIRFEPDEDGFTRLQIRMTYSPPAGILGHALATILGANPKKEIDEDLMRMKTMVESGVAPRDAAEEPRLAREATAQKRE
jgi:uncharacterized membrane protein